VAGPYAVNVRANTRKGYQLYASLHIKPYIGGTQFESLSTLAIQHMYGEILKTEYAPAKYEQNGETQICVRPAKTYSIKAVRNVHALLHLCLDQARREGLIAKNPADDAKLPAAKPKEYMIPTPEQMKQLLDELRGAGTHVVSSPFVFTTIQGKPFRPDSISQAFKRAAVKIGLPDMRLHDLRHTVITYMLEAGENPKTVSEFAGHATTQFTLNQYAHVLDQSKKRASDALMKTLFSR